MDGEVGFGGGPGGEAFAGELDPPVGGVGDADEASVGEVDVVLGEAVVAVDRPDLLDGAAGLQVHGVRRGGGEVDDAAGSGPHRPLEQGGVERQVAGGEGGLLALDDLAASDEGGAVHHQVDAHVSGSGPPEEVDGVEAVGQVDAVDLPAVADEGVVDVAADEAAVPGDQRPPHGCIQTSPSGMNPPRACTSPATSWYAASGPRPVCRPISK